jgi:dephospho-CoA kinase
MLVVGLTGGIGSGKSTVADFFSQLDVPIIDSDQLARDSVLPGTEALKNITEHFGQTILLKNGELDRKQLREKIFASKQERQWLENLLHPIIRQLMAKRLATIEAKYCIVQIPLLVNQEANPLIQRILLVDSDQILQQQRVQKRDQLEPKMIQAIIASQANREELLDAADDRISNNGSLDDLKQQVLTLHQKYAALEF